MTRIDPETVATRETRRCPFALWLTAAVGPVQSSDRAARPADLNRVADLPDPAHDGSFLAGSVSSMSAVQVPLLLYCRRTKRSVE